MRRRPLSPVGWHNVRQTKTIRLTLHWPLLKSSKPNREPLTAEELLLSKRVETNQSGTLDALVEQIRQRLPGL